MFLPQCSQIITPLSNGLCLRYFAGRLREILACTALNSSSDIRCGCLPGSTYWLTTHNWKGENRAKEILAPHLDPETVILLDKVKPSEWNELKTDAIDFEQDFLWFDDDLWPNELNVLEKHEAVQNFIMVDLHKDPDLLQKLQHIVLAN